MSDFLKTLLRKNSLRKQCQSLEISEVEKVISDLTDIVDELKADAAARAEEEQAKLAAIEEIKSKMKAAGVDVNDLVSLVDNSAPKQAVKAKYKLVDEAGNVHTWSGRGRTPVVFKNYMETYGVSKEQLPSAQ